MLISQNGDLERQTDRVNSLIDTIATLQETINAKSGTIIK